jgi:hypothetical protein
MALEARKKHRSLDPAGQSIPARELRRRRGLAAARKDMQQHDLVGVKGAVERIECLVAAEEPDIRPRRQRLIQRARHGTRAAIERDVERGSIRLLRPEPQRRTLSHHRHRPVL